jgi:hypothetical protein
MQQVQGKRRGCDERRGGQAEGLGFPAVGGAFI